MIALFGKLFPFFFLESFPKQTTLNGFSDKDFNLFGDFPTRKVNQI